MGALKETFSDYDFLKTVTKEELVRETELEKVNIEIGKSIEDTLDNSRRLYWKILEANEKQKALSKENVGILEKANEYLEYACLEIKNEGNYKETVINFAKESTSGEIPHSIKQPKNRVAVKMRSFFVGLPLLGLPELKENWALFLEAPSAKIIFTLIISLLSLVFGGFTVLTWGLLVLSSIHFITRNMANKHKGGNEYINIQRNIQLFLWTYMLLAIGTTLSYIISFNGLPEGTFISLFTVWLIWGELKGIVIEAEICNLYIPPILKKLVSKNNDDITPF